MREWRHNLRKHRILVRLVFQLAQVKNRFRPVRAGVQRNAHGVTESWERARRLGVPAVVPPPPARASSATHNPRDGVRDECRRTAERTLFVPPQLRGDPDLEEIIEENALQLEYYSALQNSLNDGSSSSSRARRAAKRRARS